MNFILCLMGYSVYISTISGGYADTKAASQTSAVTHRSAQATNPAIPQAQRPVSVGGKPLQKGPRPLANPSTPRRPRPPTAQFQPHQPHNPSVRQFIPAKPQNLRKSGPQHHQVPSQHHQLPQHHQVPHHHPVLPQHHPVPPQHHPTTTPHPVTSNKLHPATSPEHHSIFPSEQHT